MTASTEQYESLIRSAARRLKGHERRLFQAEVTDALCGGNPRAAEARFGWGRESVRTGQHEARSGIRCVEDFPAKGALPREEKEPQLAADGWRASPAKGARPGEEKEPELAADVRAIVEPCTQADPELKSPRRYTNLSAREVLAALKSQKGYTDDRLPSERSMRDVLNR